MRVFYLVLAITALSIGSSSAGVIGVYSDETGASCNFADETPTLVATHIVYKNDPTEGISAVEYMIEPDAAAGWLYVGFALGSVSYLTAGSPESGVSLALGGCITEATFRIMTVYYQTQGTAGECQFVRLLNNPNSSLENEGFVATVDCATPPGSITTWVDQTHGVINVTEECEGCESTSQTTPIAVTSWGQIKALYH